MMKKSSVKILVISILSIMILVAGLVVFLSLRGEKPEDAKKSFATYAEDTELEALAEVPKMQADGSGIENSFDNGRKNATVVMNNTKKKDYEDYLKLLQKAGFKTYVDNGEEGIAESLFTSIMKRDELVVTVVYVVNTEKTYISAENKQPLSDHLFYDKSYVKDNKTGAKTTFHMLELHDLGNSFLFQLKNGHFIVSDGGRKTDLPYLLDYLESLVPEGEKPVIEGWFFTHSHNDHTGVMSGIMSDEAMASRVIVEGVYFNTPGKAAYAKDPTSRISGQWVEVGAMALKDSSGKRPQVYRTTAGQRYYFNDLTIDIMMAQELVSPTEFHTDINETSTWCMVTVDGQKVMLVGDASRGSMANVLKVYHPTYLSMDVMTAMHHGSDTWNDFTDFSSVKTVLIPRHVFVESEANLYLKSKAQEVMIYGDGSKVLTFPYEVGTAVTLPHMEWIYHKD